MAIVASVKRCCLDRKEKTRCRSETEAFDSLSSTTEPTDRADDEHIAQTMRAAARCHQRWARLPLKRVAGVDDQADTVRTSNVCESDSSRAVRSRHSLRPSGSSINASEPISVCTRYPCTVALQHTIGTLPAPPRVSSSRMHRLRRLLTGP